MPASTPDFPDILQHFQLAGHIDDAARYGSGHINDTWLIRINHFDSRKRYVLQRINDVVFADPLAVMENIDRITNHFQNLPAAALTDRLAGQPSFAPIRTGDDQPCWQDQAGNTWRLWPFVYGASTIDKVQSAAQARMAAKAFGDFQSLLQTLPGPPLKETIAGFHDTVARFGQLRSVLDDDPLGRAAGCQAEIDFVLDCETFVRSFAELVNSDVPPARIAHNDAKINNVMLSDETGEAVCVIDLDTVMPGTPLFDFGDIVRTMTAAVAEDQANPTNVTMRMDWYAAVAEGYLAAAGDFLNTEEIHHLPDAGRVITLETGLRFLTDYLAGDPYFRIERASHNLDRCRTQLALVQSISEQLDEMRRVSTKLAT